jgi:alkylation response protein AidB-like acyl-CoA dehydrogenase
MPLFRQGLGALNDDRPSAMTERAPAAETVLAKVADLAPLVARHGDQNERDRRLTTKLLDALKSARVYGMLVPQRYGGLALDAPSALSVISALAKIDGSVGWNAMIGHVGSLIPFLTQADLCERIFADRKDHIFAGSAQPVGTAERVRGGWRVSGTWPFASGCQNAEWIGCACVMMEDGAPIAGPDGSEPMVRVCFLPAANWLIHDTWHTVGMRGTGSHHVELRDAFVPDEDIVDFPFGVSFATDPIFSMLPEYVMFSHAALATGIAEGAFADLVALSQSGVRQFRAAVPLIETERFREAVGRIGAEVMAARTLLEGQVADRWRAAQRSAPRDMARVAEAQQAATWIASTCVRVVDACFEFAGTRAIYETSPLQRRMRDLRVAAQHAFVHQRNYVAAGDAVLARRKKS